MPYIGVITARSGIKPATSHSVPKQRSYYSPEERKGGEKKKKDKKKVGKKRKYDEGVVPSCALTN